MRVSLDQASLDDVRGGVGAAVCAVSGAALCNIFEADTLYLRLLITRSVRPRSSSGTHRRTRKLVLWKFRVSKAVNEGAKEITSRVYILMLRCDRLQDDTYYSDIAALADNEHARRYLLHQQSMMPSA